MRFQGRISEWNDDKGFGFISENGSGKRVFLHIKSFSKRNRRPRLGDLITYEINTDGKGRKNAEKAIFNNQLQEPNISSSRKSLKLPLLHPSIAIAYIAFLITMAVFGKLPNGIPAIVIGLSLITFMAYFMDKYAAVKGAQRTPEVTLHILGLAGGWPGAAFAQKSFRHKSSKISFQIEFWITVILNICFIIFLLQFPDFSALHKLFAF